MLKKLVILLIFSWFLSSVFGTVAYADTLSVKENDPGKYELTGTMEYLEDIEGKMTIADVSTEAVGRLFKMTGPDVPNFGFTESVYWFKFSVNNTGDHSENFILEIDYPFLDNAELFYPAENGLWLRKSGGDMLPFSSRQIKSRQICFSVFQASHKTQTYYLRLSSENGLMQVPARLWKPLAFEAMQHQFQFVFGIVYGMILLIIINNIYLSFSFRNASYLYYVLGMISSLVFLMILNGHGYEYLWPESPEIQQHAFPVVIASLNLWMSLFGQHFLETKTKLPLFYKILSALALINAVLLLASFVLPYKISAGLAPLTSAVVFGTLLAAGIAASQRKVISGQMFSIAFGCYLAGLIIYTLKSVGFFSLGQFGDFAVKTGAVLQVMFISFALISRFRYNKDEQLKTQKEALEIQKSVTEMLEQKVAARTEEINRHAQEVEKAYKNVSLLADMGREITSSLNIEEINDKISRYISRETDSPMLGIGIHDESLSSVVYRFNTENGKQLEPLVLSVADEDNLSSWVVRNRQEIVMNDFDNEYKKYLPNKEFPVGACGSVIYLPMIVGERVFGVLTAQSYRKNAYSSKDLDVLRALTLYAAIALEHAESYQNLASSNKRMLQSIRYAKRIQDSILPPSSKLLNSFSDAFIVFRPRDIVSGDFYWYAEKGPIKIVAVVDCTGHGVPGAFMTMMGNDLLNQIINENKIYSPEKILTELDNRVMSTLHNHNSGIDSRRNDGMDISVCAINTEEKTLSFAGAKQSLYFVHERELTEIKGSAFPIGSTQIKKDKVFLLHTHPYQEGDIIYMFSDGYQDQFGGPYNAKLLKKRFRSLLREISDMPMRKQKRDLLKELDRWQKGYRQTDDILVVGIQL